MLIPTRPPVPFLHPNVAVALSHARLGVQEGHAHAPLRAQTSVVVMALLHGISVVLLAQPADAQKKKKNIIIEMASLLL